MKSGGLFRRRNIILLLILLCIGGGYMASKKAKQYGYKGLWDLVGTVTGNYWKSRQADPESISIEIKDKDLKVLEENRARALERGVIINDLDGDFVSATLEHKGKKVNVKLRLKGHMTDHLQDNKWSFRIKLKGKDDFMGMKRFSIQHPGTRGYIYEWIYHELMKRENIIALRYQFINVMVNGKDWGIYALEENFENELLDNNNRKKGPILRFNPHLYWVNRYNMMTGTASYDEFASYYSANPEAYREENVLSDSIQKVYYLKAMALIEGLRERRIKVSDAFDVKRLAKFHAIIDLVGGQHSIDWSDIKYYYNPISSLLEPVAYESFSNFPVTHISANYKYFVLDSSELFEDWHSMIFSDPVFFKAYVQELERITEPAYLENFFASVSPEMKKNMAILYKEFPYKKLNLKGYYSNQKRIRSILNPPKAVHAYFKGMKGDTAIVQVGVIESLPVLLGTLKIAGISSKTNGAILASKQKNRYVKYQECYFEMPAGMKWNTAQLDSVELCYFIPGASSVHCIKAFPFPHTVTEFISSAVFKGTQLKKSSFLHIDEIKKVVFFKRGHHVIKEDVIIPKGYSLIANDAVSLDLRNGATLVSYSPISFQGKEESPVMITSGDSSSAGILVSSELSSTLEWVVFKGLPKRKFKDWPGDAAITFYESKVKFKNCLFVNCKAGSMMDLVRTEFLFDLCAFQNASDNGVEASYSTGIFRSSSFEGIGGNAITSTFGNVKLSNVYVKDVKKRAVKIRDGGQCIIEKLKLKDCHEGVSAENGAMIIRDGVKIYEKGENEKK